MSRSMRATAGSLLAGLLLATAAPARADESVAAARDLYAGAAYEEALALLGRLQPIDARDERAIAQYRAFCLLALGRSSEADSAIERLVAAEPFYQPPETEASPRLRVAFGDVRRRMLPGIIQERYGRARAAFERKELPAAREGFAEVLALLSDPGLGAAANQPPLADLRMLAAGFNDLTASIPSTPLPLPLPSPAPASAGQAARPAPPRIYTNDDANVVGPVAVKQTMPPVPYKPLFDSRGALSIVIDEAGGVESASMLEPLRSPYDHLLLEAASSWRYKPASLDGTPVKFRKIIAVTVAVGK